MLRKLQHRQRAVSGWRSGGRPGRHGALGHGQFLTTNGNLTLRLEETRDLQWQTAIPTYSAMIGRCRFRCEYPRPPPHDLPNRFRRTMFDDQRDPLGIELCSLDLFLCTPIVIPHREPRVQETIQPPPQSLGSPVVQPSRAL